MNRRANNVCQRQAQTMLAYTYNQSCKKLQKRTTTKKQIINLIHLYHLIYLIIIMYLFVCLELKNCNIDLRKKIKRNILKLLISFIH